MNHSVHRSQHLVNGRNKFKREIQYHPWILIQINMRCHRSRGQHLTMAQKVKMLLRREAREAKTQEILFAKTQDEASSILSKIQRRI